MQLKSDKKLYADRLDRLYAKRGVTWEEIAKDLGVGVAMLMMVRTGKRGMSAKSLYRLEEAERAAGIEPEREELTPFYNPSNDPQVAQRAADIFGALAAELKDLPPEKQDKINSHFLQVLMLMVERSAAPAQEYMDMIKRAVDRDKKIESERRRPNRNN